MRKKAFCFGLLAFSLLYSSSSSTLTSLNSGVRSKTERAKLQVGDICKLFSRANFTPVSTSSKPILCPPSLGDTSVW